MKELTATRWIRGKPKDELIRKSTLLISTATVSGAEADPTTAACAVQIMMRAEPTRCSRGVVRNDPKKDFGLSSRRRGGC